MSSKLTRKESRFIRYIKKPAKILARARDLYVRSMMGCAGPMGQGSAMACSGPQFSTLPRSFSVSSSYSTASEEDMRELIRAASTRSLSGKIGPELELLRLKRPSPLRDGGGVAVVPRSRTVVIGRIDEDKPCEFGVSELDSVIRSRSYAGRAVNS